MTTPRDFLALVEPDHQLFLSAVENRHRLEDVGKALRLKCSCGWETRRLAPWKEIEDGYSTTLTSEWTDRERLNHLLDQELDKVAIVDLAGRVS